MPIPRSLLLLCVGCWSLPVSVDAFMLTFPRDDAALVAGQSVDVAVDLGTDIGVSRVEYYWYRVSQEPVVEQRPDSSLTATSTSSPPFGGKILVPLEGIGHMRLLAVGDVTRGRLAGEEEFDEVIVKVTAPAKLGAIEFETQKPWRLDTIGKIVEVPVVGQFADGVTRRITGSSSGSSYHSSHPEVISVDAEGQARVMNNGRAVITVTNGGKQGTLDVVVRSDGDPSNRPPIANAGTDVTVKSGSTVALNGLQSVDPDGDPIQYEWMQVRGNKVSLLDSSTSRATFVAPRVSSKRLLRFVLRVTDMKGPDTLKGADSSPAYVNVWVVP